MKRQTYLDTLDHFMAKVLQEWDVKNLDVPTKNLLHRLELSREVNDWKALRSSVQAMVKSLVAGFTIDELSDWEFHFLEVSVKALGNWKEMFV